jgi:hypothetical protein
VSDDHHGLMRQLRSMWHRLDPEPAGLVDRVMFALELETLDVDLLWRLPEPELAAARSGEEETARTVTFGSESLTVVVMLSGSDTDGHRIDGWVIPSGPLRVELRSDGSQRQTTADETGRFAFADVSSGLVQLVLHPTDGVHPALTRPVVTPALKL